MDKPDPTQPCMSATHDRSGHPATATARLRLRRWLGRLAAGMLLPCAVEAAQTTVNFAGTVDFIQEDHYGLAQPIPPEATPLLPLFAGATRIEGSYTYDPAVAVDSNPDLSAGQYLTPGSFTMRLPDIGLSITSTGPNVGFSVYPGTNGEFHVNANAGGTFSGNLGGATPFALSFVFYTPIAGDALPTAAVPWTYGNAYIDLENVTPLRDIFIGVAPVPEPSIAVCMSAGLLMLGMRARRRNPGAAANPQAAPTRT